MIRAGRALGYRVLSSGNRPDEAGHRESDRYCPADFSDREALLTVARDERIDAICANCNDFSALSCAWVAETLGLPGHDPYETCRLIHHKDAFRAYTNARGLPTPRAARFDDRAAAREHVREIDRDLIIKPVDLTGGKGVQRAGTADEARAAIDRAFDTSRAGRIVVEEYIEGTNHGFSCFLRDGRVVFHFSDNENYYLNRYLVSGASTPSRAPERAIDRLVEVAEFMADDLDLVDGLFHVQFKLRDDEPVVIEICRRPPGDLYVDLVRHATGVDYPSWIVRAAAGLDLSDLAHAPPRGCYGRHCVMADRDGVVAAVEIDPEVRDLIVEQVMWGGAGSRIEQHLTEKLGIVFLRFPDQPSMDRLMEEMPERIKVRIRP